MNKRNGCNIGKRFDGVSHREIIERASLLHGAHTDPAVQLRAQARRDEQREAHERLLQQNRDRRQREIVGHLRAIREALS